jgi:flagellin-like protein
MFKKAQEKTDAVSPVIGVILLVAVTVALVALATVIVFDIGSDVSDTADATVQLEQQGSDMTATVIRNENVDTFSLQVDGTGSVATGDEFGTESGAGASAVASGLADGDTVSVIATLEDGSEEVLTSTDYTA